MTQRLLGKAQSSHLKVSEVPNNFHCLFFIAYRFSIRGFVGHEARRLCKEAECALANEIGGEGELCAIQLLRDHPAVYQ